ncbi:MAG: hypothetical protein KIT87_16205 [Anaerolineae bacterium]|nr:hypothetical protein [Anaerolineae bacterium]
MDAHPPDYFADIVQAARQAFEQVDATVDATPARAILRLEARYGIYRIIVTELLDSSVRKYRYYALRDHIVEVGFDNSPDPRALRLKYGRIGEQHVGELIPHMHLANKTTLHLTDELTLQDFVAWLKQHLPI